MAKKEESYSFYEAVSCDDGSKEIQQGSYDWVGKIQRKEIALVPRLNVDQKLRPIGLFYKYGVYFAVFLGFDEDDIKVWVELLDNRGPNGNDDSFRVRLCLMYGDGSLRCSKYAFSIDLPKSASSTLRTFIPEQFCKDPDMSNLVGWSLKVKVDKVGDPDPKPMGQAIEILQPVEVKMCNKETQVRIRPKVKNAATEAITLRKASRDQETQTEFRQISLMSLMKVVPKSTADAIVEAKPSLDDSQTQTNGEDKLVEVETNTELIVIAEDKEVCTPDLENDALFDVGQIIRSFFSSK